MLKARGVSSLAETCRALTSVDDVQYVVQGLKITMHHILVIADHAELITCHFKVTKVKIARSDQT